MTLARMVMFCFFALSALCFISCQQKSTALYHVSGKVSYKGVSLQSGIIVFSPDTNRGETGKVAFSKIESDGSYTLHTGDAAGVTAGWYRVTVAALGGPTANLESPPVSLVPDKYRDPLLSQLQCEVKANRDNHLDFNLD